MGKKGYGKKNSGNSRRKHHTVYGITALFSCNYQHNSFISWCRDSFLTKYVLKHVFAIFYTK